MKYNGKTKRYEYIPTTVSIPLKAVLADDEKLGADALSNKKLRVKQLDSEECTIQDAENLGALKIQECKKILDSADQIIAVIRLVEDDPRFVQDPWVMKRLCTFIDSGRPLRKRGRPKGSFTESPVVIAVFVDHLVRRKDAPSAEKAYGKLEELGVVTSDIARRRYDQAKRETRFQALLINNPVHYLSDQPKHKTQA